MGHTKTNHHSKITKTKCGLVPTTGITPTKNRNSQHSPSPRHWIRLLCHTFLCLWHQKTKQTPRQPNKDQWMQYPSKLSKYLHPILLKCIWDGCLLTPPKIRHNTQRTTQTNTQWPWPTRSNLPRLVKFIFNKYPTGGGVKHLSLLKYQACSRLPTTRTLYKLKIHFNKIKTQ